MNIFKNVCLTWWQAAMFKWGVFGCGLLVGAYFNKWVTFWVWPIAFLTIVFCVYVTIIWVQQKN